MSDLKGFVIKQHMTELSSMQVPTLGHLVICFDVVIAKIFIFILVCSNKECRSAEFNRWRHVSARPAQAKFWAVRADSLALLTERIRGRVK